MTNLSDRPFTYITHAGVLTTSERVRNCSVPGECFPVAIRELEALALNTQLLFAGALSCLGRLGIPVAVVGSSDHSFSQEGLELIEQGQILRRNNADTQPAPLANDIHYRRGFS